MIILRNTVIYNSLRGVRFLFRMLRTSTMFILGCSPSYCSRVSSLFIPHEIYIYIFHVSSNMYKLWLLLCYLRVPFQLGSTPGFHVVHIPKGNLVLLCIIVFFWPLTFFSLPAAGLSSCSRFLWYARSPPRPLTQVWVLAKVRGTCSGGSKWQVRSARDSEHVEPSRPMKTHVHNSCGTF